MKRLLKFLYKISPRTFEDVLVEAYYLDIPDSVKKPTVQILSDYHVKLNKLMLFMAYQLQRKNASDVKYGERYQGMFIQLKIMSTLIESARQSSTEKQKEEEQKRQDVEWFNSAIEGVQKFIQKK